MLPSLLSHEKPATPKRTPRTAGSSSESARLHAPHAPPEYGAKAAYFIDQATGGRAWWSALLFDWFSPVMALGTTRRLHAADLFPLCDAHSAAAVAPRLARVWDQEKHHRGKQASLARALLGAFGLRLTTLTAARLVHGALAVTLPPLLTKALVEYSQDASAAPIRGLAVALAVAVGGSLVSLMERHADYFSAELALFVQSSVSTAVFKHTLVVSPSTLQRTASDDVVGYVMTDAAQLRDGLIILLELSGAFAQIVCGGLLLYSLVGNAAWAGFVVAAVGVGCAGVAEMVASQYEVPVMEAKDKRIHMTQELVAGIKTLKLLTWEKSVADRIVELRDDELRRVRTQLFARAAVVTLAAAVPFLVTTATLVTYVLLTEGPLEAATTFPTLMLLQLLLHDPLSLMLKRAIGIRDASVSLFMLNAFLVEPVRFTATIPHHTAGADVTVKNADFKWDTTARKTELDLLLEAQGIIAIPVPGPVLHHINFFAAPGEFHAVVGAPGSGKSSLLAGIVGLVRCSAGEVNVYGSVAYVTRETFLLNGTIRENICFGQPYDAQRYVRALKASCLKYDWPTLPQGDQTVVGSDSGVALTVSQRIRVSLARSLYKNADIYVFDDILAGMDAKIAKKIFNKCVQTALKSKIVIMATMSLKFVKRATNTTVIARGTIVESGDSKSLIANKWGLLSELICAHSSKSMNADEIVNDDADSSDETDNDSDGDESLISLNLAEFAPVISETSPESQMVDDEICDDNVRMAVALWLLRALGEKGYVVFGFVAGLHIATVLFQLASISAYGKLDASRSLLEAYVAFGVLSVLSAAASTVAVSLGSLHASRAVRQSLIERLSRAPMAFFDATPTNRVVVRVSKDLSVVDAGIVSTWPGLVSSAMQLIATLGLLMALSPWILFVLVPLIFGLFRLEERSGSSTRDLECICSASPYPIQSCVTEVLRGMTPIRIYSAEHIFLSQFHQRMDHSQQAFMFNVCAKTWLGVRVDALYVALTSFASLAVVYGHMSTDPSAQLQAGKAGVALIFAFSLSPVLVSFIKTCDDMWHMLLAGGRIKAYTKMPVEATLESAPQLRPSLDWPAAGAIEFDNVSLRYRQGLPRILRGVSFSVAGGSSLAIIGNPGSGKKSIFAALARVVEAATGTISIDAVDISKIGLHDLRSKIAVLPPDPTFFGGSIRSNLDATHRFTDDQIWTAIKAVGLHGAVLSLDEVVHERASNYSDGERQQLSIARAMLRRPRIVMIDEGEDLVVNSPEAELIDQCIQEAFSSATRLTITQRTSTATSATAVMVMVNGQIAEIGTPKELQKSARSMFRSILDHWKRRDHGHRKKP